MLWRGVVHGITSEDIFELSWHIPDPHVGRFALCLAFCFLSVICLSNLLSYRNLGFLTFLGRACFAWLASVVSAATSPASFSSSVCIIGFSRPSLETLTVSTVTVVYLSSSIYSSSWSMSSRSGRSGNPVHSSNSLSWVCSSVSSWPAVLVSRMILLTSVTCSSTSRLRSSRA